MDIVTQGILGAALATAAAPRGELRTAALAGLAGGLLADADVFIHSPDDPLLALEFHRHFTHALLFVPVGALVAALALWPLLRGRLAFRRIYLYSFLGYCLSGTLDACTGYGTHLLWPLSDARTAWNLVAIVDPLFSLALLVPLLLGLRSRRAATVRVGLGLAALYLAFAAFQQQRAGDALAALAASRGDTVERVLVRPTFGNTLLWRGLYVSGASVHAAAIHAGLDIRVYEGDRAALVTDPAEPDAARFAALTDGWLIAHPHAQTRLGDARYAMHPTSLRPMWNVEPAPGGGVQLVTDRRMTRSERDDFVQMLLGAQPAVAPPG